VLEYLEEGKILRLFEIVAVAHNHDVVDEIRPKRYFGNNAEQSCVE
jgi:hypothetical protein